MTVKTTGPRRGLIGRWLMRIQSVQAILALVGIAVTAASTLTSALVALGHPEYAPAIIGVGLVGTPVFAYVYVEWGLLNRKNREAADRGANWVGPSLAIGQVVQASMIGAAIRAHQNSEDPKEAALDAAKRQLRRYRNGADMDELLALECDDQGVSDDPL